ncbi:MULTISPECIES: hypothetical protein [unclassified Microbulbifer]|uniref:hypothetical protein n=1 Tax=unclassified Microbulbifer TaxID=2619833 RepID=UPI0027E5898B|nr:MULTISPECIES: hypothetical protein [unclassified Microbulbifer]
MKKVNLDGQNLIFLNQDDISHILETGSFEGDKLFHLETLSRALHEYREYRGVEVALMGAKGRYQLICFITIAGEKHRVHIEDVICEHCDKRSGISGTPGVWDLYFFCTDPRDMWKRAMALPVKKCVHCSGSLSLRHTIWFEHEERS